MPAVILHFGDNKRQHKACPRRTKKRGQRVVDKELGVGVERTGDCQPLPEARALGWHLKHMDICEKDKHPSSVKSVSLHRDRVL